MSKYDHILHLSRPVSPRHPPMSRANRAAQFAPFAALSGYDDAVEEAGRPTQQRRDLSEEEREELNHRLSLLQQRSVERPQVTLVFFRDDPRKEGGAYLTVTGRFRQMDPVKGDVVLEDWRRVPAEDLYDVRSPLFGDRYPPDD